jgi:shikimate dehydrogenase
MNGLPTRLVLLGHPVAHSLSPAIQNAALRAAGIAARYEALDVAPDAIEDTVARFRAHLRGGGSGAERIAGNVTVPHKERIYALCDERTALAERVGAVNTFWFDERDRLVGDNTDVGGFALAAIELLGAEPRGITVGVYGAGGAAAAVLAAVESWPGCVAHVYNRTPERARLLCERFSSVAQWVDDIGVIAGADLVVNATSVGLKGDDLPIDPVLVPPASAVLDLVYRPGQTRFVQLLHARSIRARDGSAMLVEQAALAFERWFGRPADRTVMWSAMPA